MFQFSKKLVLFLSFLLPYSMAQSSSVYGSCWTSYSNETMDLDQVIPPPRKSWCCCSQPYLPDFEESLHLLDRSLRLREWVKTPIVEDESSFTLLGYYYRYGPNWIAIVREYTDAKSKHYKLNSKLEKKDNYYLAKEIERIKTLFKNNAETNKKYFSLTENGLEVMNDPQSKPFSTLLEAGGKAQKLGDDFVEGLLPIPLSGINTEPAPVTVLRDKLQDILRSRKAKGVTIEVDIDKRNAYLQARPPYTRSEHISVYFHNGNREERASAAASSSSFTSALGVINQVERFK